MRILIATAATVLFIVAHAQAAPLFFDDFNSYDPVASIDGSAAFEALYTTPSAMSIDAGIGLGGTNALGNSGDSQLVRDTLPIDLGDGAVSVSLYFRYEGSGGLAGPQIGLTATGNVTGSGDVSGRLNGNKLELRVANSSALIDSTAQSLTTGNWYQIVFTASRSATPDQLDLTIALNGSDANGNLTGQIASLSTSVTNATIYASDSLNAIVRENTSITRMDNFAAAQIPEPATLALIGASSLLIATRRRR